MNSEEINSNISINNDGVEIEGIFIHYCAFSWTSYHIQAHTHSLLLCALFSWNLLIYYINSFTHSTDLLNIGESTIVTVNRDQVEDALVSSAPIVEGVTGWKVKLYLLEPEGTILFILFKVLT